MRTAEDRGLAAAEAGRGWWLRARWVPLRVLAGLLVFIGVVAAVGGVARDVAAATRVYAQFAVAATPLLLVLLILALAEAFRRGTQLARDADGLV